MPAQIETAIWLALKSRILTLPGSPVVAYPASLYSPTPGSPFLAVSRVSIEPERILIKAGKNLRRGTLTITDVRDLGQDTAVYEDAGAAIANHFAEDTLMRYTSVCVRVTDRPHVADGYRDGGWWRTPVNIRWDSFA